MLFRSAECVREQSITIPLPFSSSTYKLFFISGEIYLFIFTMNHSFLGGSMGGRAEYRSLPEELRGISEITENVRADRGMFIL